MFSTRCYVGIIVPVIFTDLSLIRTDIFLTGDKRCGTRLRCRLSAGELLRRRRWRWSSRLWRSVPCLASWRRRGGEPSTGPLLFRGGRRRRYLLGRSHVVSWSCRRNGRWTGKGGGLCTLPGRFLCSIVLIGTVAKRHFALGELAWTEWKG